MCLQLCTDITALFKWELFKCVALSVKSYRLSRVPELLKSGQIGNDWRQMEMLPLVSEKIHIFTSLFWHTGICFLVITEQDDKVAENNSHKIRRTWYFETGLYSVVTGNIREKKWHNMSCFGTLKMASALPCFRHSLDNVLIIKPEVHWQMKKKSLSAVLSITFGYLGAAWEKVTSCPGQKTGMSSQLWKWWEQLTACKPSVLKELVVLLLKCTPEKAAATKVRGIRGEDLGQMSGGDTGKETFWGTEVTHVRVGTAQGTAAQGSTPEGLGPWSREKMSKEQQKENIRCRKCPWTHRTNKEGLRVIHSKPEAGWC